MSKLNSKTKGGLLLTIIVIAVIMFLGYVVISRFVNSDKGQEIQQTTNQVIDTVDSVTNTIDKVSP